MNPGKKQPTQGSFKPTRNSNQVSSNVSGLGDSFINHSAMNENQNNQGGEYTEENVLEYAKGQQTEKNRLRY